MYVKTANLKIIWTQFCKKSFKIRNPLAKVLQNWTELFFFDDSEVLTQTPESPKTQEGSYGRLEYLKNEQKLMEQQMQLNLESMKLRFEIASKKFKWDEAGFVFSYLWIYG